MIQIKRFLLCILVSLFISNFCLAFSNTQYIIAESDGGLSNRLRSMISHMFLAKVLHNNAHLVMIWDVNDACPGHFLQVFKPLENVTFISNSSKALFEKNAVKVYPNSRHGFERTMLEYDVNLIVKRRTWWNIELEYWELLEWTREVDERVELYVRDNSICNITSMHIRKTDMDLDLNPKKRPGYDLYYKWVDTRPEGEAVYLMTDNPSTQQTFVNKYGPHKIRVYANITSPEDQLPYQGIIKWNPAIHSHANFSVTKHTKRQKALAIDHRFTTLEHAVIDILIAAHARDFRPYPFSSVSDFVRMMNFLHRWQWCGCTFRGC